MLGLATKGAVVVDLFAGSGAIGLEAISRGAASCMFVEHGRPAAAVLQQNIDTLGCGDRAKVVLGDALGVSIIARCPRPVDLVFLDPPYPLVLDALTWVRVKSQAEQLLPLLAEKGFLILRTPWPFIFDQMPPGEAEDEAEIAAAKPAKRFKKKGKGDKFRWDENAPAGKNARRSPRPDRRAGANPGERKPPRVEHLHREALTDAELDNDDFGNDASGLDAAGADDQVLYEIGIDSPEALRELMRQGGGGDEHEHEHEARGADDDRGELTASGIPLPPGFAEAVAAQNTRKESVDLTLIGGRGPETHIYGNMAVHFYMKQ